MERVIVSVVTVLLRSPALIVLACANPACGRDEETVGRAGNDRANGEVVSRSVADNEPYDNSQPPAIYYPDEPSPEAFVPPQTDEGALPPVTGFKIVRDEKFGEHLATSEGRAVYAFTEDTPSAGPDFPIACKGTCLSAWPAVIREGGDLDNGAAVKANLIGQRIGPARIVATYNGWPLYYYAEDRGPSAKGHGEENFGGYWRLVSPAGELIEGT